MSRVRVKARADRPSADLPPGLVAVTADEAGRFTTFATSMQQLWLPAGSKTAWQIGNDTPGNRNAACEAFLADETLEWLWFVDDDHHFSHDILARLLLRDVPVVAPLVLRRTQPFLPVACKLDGEHLSLHDNPPTDQLVEVLHTGSSGMLISRAVVKAVEEPWFVLKHDRTAKGEHTTVSEDVVFCQSVREVGFPIHVDTAVPMGHITTAVVWPVHSQGRWVTGLTVANGCQLMIEPGLADDDDLSLT